MLVVETYIILCDRTKRYVKANEKLSQINTNVTCIDVLLQIIV